MSTKNVENLTTRTATQGRGKVLTQGRFGEGFNDHTGVHPSPGTEETTIVNKGGKSIDLFGADVPDDTIQGTYNEYTKVYEFNYGNNSFEFNTTPGNERIMLRHSSGSGVNIGPDGSVIISGHGNRIDKAADYILEVSNGQMTFSGNLSLNVTGDLNLNVGGEFNVSSSKKNEKINGPSETDILGDDVKTVSGNQTNLVLGGGVNQYLEGLSTIVKGESRYVVEGSHTDAVSGVLTMTAEEEVILTSPETNIAADNLSVFGDTGTIGGENIIAYVKNVYGVSGDFSARFKAPVFEGDLTGTANQAIRSDVTNSQSYSDPSTGGGVGSAAGFTVNDTEIDDTATALPTASLLSEYRTKGAKGVKKVQVDPGNVIKNNINLSAKTAGVTTKELTKAELRRKMRDPAHRANTEFTTLAISQGKLSPEFVNLSPPNISAVEDTSTIIVQGQTPIGSPSPALTSKRIKV